MINPDRDTGFCYVHSEVLNTSRMFEMKKE